MRPDFADLTRMRLGHAADAPDGPDDLRALKAKVDDLERQVKALAAAGTPQTPAPPGGLWALVTLDQIAGSVARCKSALEKYKKRGMPPPTVRGGRGKPSLWAWPAIRPWLEETFHVRLCEDRPMQRRVL